MQDEIKMTCRGRNRVEKAWKKKEKAWKYVLELEHKAERYLTISVDKIEFRLHSTTYSRGKSPIYHLNYFDANNKELKALK